MPERGWRRLGGSAERYIDPSGRNVSRRQYENARARDAGWRNWSEYQRARKSDEYNRQLNYAIAEQNLTRRDIGPRSDFSRKFLAVRDARQNDAPNLYDPDGPLADWLVYIGRRKPDDWWDVGDTPQGIGK